MKRCTLLAALMVVCRAWAAPGPVTILESRTSVAPSVKEWTFTVPAFSVEHQVRLSLEARIDKNRLAGSNHWLRVAVNGNYVTKPDLLNKRNEFRIQRGIDLLWVKGDRWRILYSHDFKAAIEDKDNGYACPNDDPYRFVWDVTRSVQPGENKLRIQHLQVLAKPSTLVLRNVQVDVGKAISPPTANDATPAPTGPLPTFVAKGAQAVSMHVGVGGDGALTVAAPGWRFELATRTSVLGGRWREPKQAADTGLTQVGRSSEAGWATPRYKVERRVTLRSDHVRVADKITNTTDKLIGVIVDHRMAWPKGEVKAARVSGRPAFGERTQASNPAHPSVFAEWKDVGLGLVAEDDIFRVHCRSYRDAEGLGLMEDRLGLEPGRAVTLEWSIYPVPRGDYWDFVNAVRRNWDTNFEIPGPFHFVSAWREKNWDAATWGKWMRDRGIKFACGGIVKYPHGKYAHGTGLLHAPKWAAAERKWADKIKAAAPQVVPTAYFHAQCCTEPDGETKFADSRLIDTKGEHMMYPYRYPLPLYLPTRENAYGKAIFGFIDALIDDVGVKAIYWDEMSHSVLWFAEQAPWDGCSVRISKSSHKVIAKWTSVPLIMQPLKLDIIRHVRSRVGQLFANTQPATRTMTQQKIVRFVETGSYSAIVNTHLGCPWALANHHQEKTHADATLNVRRILDHGAVYCGYIYYRDAASWNFTDVMYPITPLELYEGVVIGQERIHTARSGRFGWPDGAAADVFVVDANAARAAGSMVKEIVTGGRRLYEIRMPSDHFAVLVRR